MLDWSSLWRKFLNKRTKACTGSFLSGLNNTKKKPAKIYILCDWCRSVSTVYLHIYLHFSLWDLFKSFVAEGIKSSLFIDSVNL